MLWIKAGWIVSAWAVVANKLSRGNWTDKLLVRDTMDETPLLDLSHSPVAKLVFCSRPQPATILCYLSVKK
jgi:hypothetical protein